MAFAIPGSTRIAVIGIAASVALGLAGVTATWNGAAAADAADPPSERELRDARFAVTATIGSVATLATFSTALLLQTRRQRRAQAALERARSEADAASRAKTEFLANMSHEIRTPMTAILGYVDLLAEGGTGVHGAPSRDEAVDTIRRNARHLLSVLNDMLDLSKIESGHMEVDRQPVRTVDLVQDVMRLMDDRARRRGIALRLALEGEVPEGIVTDPTRLRQILINLVGNAVKFTEHGSVTVTVRREPGERRMLGFEVADTGIGMTAEQLSRLYQPFVQADPSTTRRFGGTGLGLAITHRCVDMLGGTISVRSAPGAGTTFDVRLDAGDMEGAPLASLRSGGSSPAHAAPESADRPARVGRQPLSGVRVLLAEDGIDGQRLIRFHLERAGARVTVVGNGAKAVEEVHAASRLDRHDVILMDMQMPVMDGYDAARRLAATGDCAPIIALTAQGMTGDRERCLDAGCRDYLCKPIDARALIAAIRHAIAPGATECTAIRQMPRETPEDSRLAPPPADIPSVPRPGGPEGPPFAR